jgi:uncharacterized protein (DUF1697 family)
VARYIALIRGINVGGRQKLAMADLRAVLAGLGCTGARTLLQSGNAVFDAEGRPAGRLERDIAAGIEQTAGLSVRCLVRERAELDAVIAANPFGHVTDGARLYAMFLSAEPDPRLLAEHDPAGLDPGRIMLGDRVIYQWCPAGYAQAPPLAVYTEKRLQVAVTARNWNTVTKLASLASTLAGGYSS